MLSYPSWIMIYYSLTVVPMGLVKTILNLVPFLVLIISYFAVNEKL
jgi:predicted membrane chloride channel (bestrophin family)